MLGVRLGRFLIVCTVAGSAWAAAASSAGAETRTATATNQRGCEFRLGFKAVRDLIPERVGQCVENERHNPSNGDALQQTTGGMLAWRKADNWTAFTDGHRTWINGPSGLQQRLNTERFAWEQEPRGTASSAPASTTARTAPARVRVSATDYLPSDQEIPSGLRRIGDDTVRVEGGYEVVGRRYAADDWTNVFLFSARAASIDAAAASCTSIVDHATGQGLDVVADTRRGEGGVVMVGTIRRVPATAVFFRYGVFCGGGMIVGPIAVYMGSGNAEPSTGDPLHEALVAMEKRARAYPDGFR